MDSELEDFISHLDENELSLSNQQMNAMWKELEEYFDTAFFDIDKYLDELFPATKFLPSPQEDNIPIPEPSTTVIMEEKLFKSFAKQETDFNGLIRDTALNFQDKDCVPTESLLNSIRSLAVTLTCRHYHHPFENVSYHSGRSAAPIQIDFITNIDMNLNPSPSPSIDWHTLLQNEEPCPGIAVDVMVRNILRSCSEVQILPTEKEFSDVICSLFMDLNDYINCLSVEFDGHKFFDALQLDDMSRQFQQEILSRSNIKTTSLLDILSKWMKMVTKNFILINDERRQVEEKVLLKIIDRAVEVYRKRIVSVTSDEDISIVRKKQSDIICQGMRRVYSNCGVDFAANALRELEKRFKDENSAPEKPRIPPRRKKPPTNDSEVLIELLVSEYASSINQKGLQCAGISTIQQFDDVNATCLADIHRIFQRKTIEVPLAEQNDLKSQLTSRLIPESSSKRSEFKQRLHEVSSISSTRSPTEKWQSVGIHFGFESLSVSYFNRVNKDFRAIYGPLEHVVSFAPSGVFIGEIPASGCFSLTMKNLLTKLNVGHVYDTKYYGDFKLEAIIALVLMQIDEVVKKNLHTIARINYAIAIPSCLNETMRQTFKTAMNIAEINGNLVREQCALTTNFIRENYQDITNNRDEFVITMVENDKKACDSVVYQIAVTERDNRMIKVLCTDGSEANRGLLYFNKNTGLHNELQKLQSKHDDKRNRFLICNEDRDGTTNQIKSTFYKSKIQHIKFDSRKLAEGAALLSSVAVDGNSNLKCPFDFSHLTSMNRPNGGVSSRLAHHGYNADPQNLSGLSKLLRSLIANHTQGLVKSKTATKQYLVGKLKDLEESRLPDDKKIEHRRNLEKDLKAVDEESMNTIVVERIADSWKKNKF